MPGFKEVGEILSIIDSSSCEEVVLETQEIKLVVHRRGAGRAAGESASQPAPAAPAAPAAAAPADAAKTAPPVAPKSTGAAPAEADAGATTVRAPVVGTFYRSPSPDEPPFVETGSSVRQGDPLCMIEVMKLFTTIHAETDGVIESIGAENAQVVEFGQVLFTIRSG